MSAQGDSGAEAGIRQLLNQPESEGLEFKSELRDPEQAAALIAAMANSGGGQIVLGANESSEAVGLQNPAQTRKLLESGVAKIEPRVTMSLEETSLDGQTLLLAELHPDPGKGPFVPPSGPIQRRDTQGRHVALSGTELAREARAGGGGEPKVDELLDEMNARLKTMEKKAEAADERARVAFAKAEKARSIKGQLLGWVISGVIGAAIGVGATALIGG